MRAMTRNVIRKVQAFEVVAQSLRDDGETHDRCAQAGGQQDQKTNRDQRATDGGVRVSFGPPLLGSNIFFLPAPEAIHETVAIKQIVRIERNDLPLRCDEMDAGTLHRGDAEIEAVEKLHDDDTEDFVVAEIARHFDLRQATKANRPTPSSCAHRLKPATARSNSLFRNSGECSNVIAFGALVSSCSLGMRRVIGVTSRPLRKP
jgi:hypothetical protein